MPNVKISIMRATSSSTEEEEGEMEVEEEGGLEGATGGTRGLIEGS